MVGVLAACVLPARARAQVRTAWLIITVIDQIGGVLARAVVQVTGLEYGSVTTSPGFLKPNAAFDTRRVNVSMKVVSRA